MEALAQTVENSYWLGMLIYALSAVIAYFIGSMLRKKYNWEFKTANLFFIFLTLWFASFFLIGVLPRIFTLVIRSGLLGLYFGILPAKAWKR